MNIFYGWWIVLASAILGFYVAGTVFYSFTAFVDPLVQEFGWSYTSISLASSLRGLEMGIFAPIVGILVDKYGPKKIVILGIITVGFGLILLSFTQSLIMFYLAFLFLALGAGGCTSVVVMVTVANWFNKKVGLAMGIAVSGFGAAGLMIPVVVKLIEIYGWRKTLVMLGIGAWLLGLPLSLVIRDKPEKYGLLPDGASPAPPDEEVEDEVAAYQLSMKQVLKNKTFLMISFAEAIRFLTVGAIIMHIMPYLNSIGVARNTAGFVAAAVPVISMVGRSGFGVVADRIDKRWAMAIAYSLMGFGLLTFSFINYTWILVIFLVTFAPGYGGGMTLRGAVIRDYFGTAHFGKVIGLTMGIGSVTGIIGPTLAGYIFDTFGTYRPLWFGLTALSLVGIFLVLSLQPPPSRVKKNRTI